MISIRNFIIIHFKCVDSIYTGTNKNKIIILLLLTSLLLLLLLLLLLAPPPPLLLLPLLTYVLTPRTAVLEKLTGSQLVKEFPAFYGTRRFITAFTSPPPHFPKVRLNIILPSTPRSPKWSFPPGFPTCYLPICSTCLAHLILLDLITRIIFGEEYVATSTTTTTTSNNN